MKKTAMTNDPSVAGTKILQFNTNLPEPFDKAEIEGFNGQQPLIEFVSQSTDWLKLQVQPFLYDNLPVTIGKNNINLTWKTVEENGTKPVAPDAGLQFIQPNKNVVLQVTPNQLGQMPTLNPSQKLRFDLYQIVEDDYKMVVPQLKSALNERYDWYISDTYCGGITSSQCNDPEDCKFCAKKAKTKYNLNSDISAYNFANSALGDALMTVVNSSTYPQPPAAQSTDVNITYRLPGKGGVSTLTSITLGGTGNKPSAGDTKGKSGYVPTQDASRSGNDALKILDFLKLDDKVLNYSDLQTEADDLYAKHGFRTYVISEYYLWKNFTKAAKLEYINDVKKRIQAINTDGTPFIVVNLSLGKDLDFQEEILYFRKEDWDHTNEFTNVQWELFRKFIVTEFAKIGNKKLDVEELNKATEYVTNSFDAREKYKEYNPRQYFRDGNIGNSSNKTSIKDVRSEEVFTYWNNNKNTILALAKEVKNALKPVLKVLNDNKTNASLKTTHPNELEVILDKWKLIATIAEIDNMTENTIFLKFMQHFTSVSNYFDSGNDNIDINKIPVNLKLSIGIDGLNSVLKSKWTLFRNNNYVQEVTSEWTRFDDELTGTEVTTLINKLNTEVRIYIKDDKFDFHAGELKAYLARETADFTDKNIVGINNKVKGIVQTLKLNKLYVGLPQVDTKGKATQNALNWVSSGITFSQSDIGKPEKAFQLAAGYIGFVAKELGAEEYFEPNKDGVLTEQNGQSMHPLYPAKGIDMKCLIMAGYNTGAGNVRKQVLAKINKQINKNTNFGDIYSWDTTIENLFRTSPKDELHQAPYTICGFKWRMGEDFNNCKAHE